MAEFVKEAVRAVLGLPCLFRFFTGLYCPGCGGTRAAAALLSGDIGKSLYYHPFVLYMAVAAAAEAVLWAGGRLGLIRAGGFGRRYRWWTVGALIVVAANWIIKNFVLVFMGIPLI